MQKGTAEKWILAMRETTALLTTDQLGYSAPDFVDGNPVPGSERLHLSPFGLLLRTVAPDHQRFGWDGVSLVWFGEQFAVPEDTLKRAKMKTDGDRFTDETARKALNDHGPIRGWNVLASIAEETYATL